MKKRENNPNLPKSPCGGFRGLGFVFAFILLFIGCRNDRPHLPANKLPKDYTTENLLEMNRVLAEKETKEIEAFVEQSELDFTQSPLGFWHHIEYQGNGNQIIKGDKVRVTYNLSLLDGTVCYTPQNKGDKTITIGKFDIIKGLDESLLLLNEGGRGTFIIPSDLAFAMIGDQDCIGAKKTVIYEIKTLEIIN